MNDNLILWNSNKNRIIHQTAGFAVQQLSIESDVEKRKIKSIFLLEIGLVWFGFYFWIFITTDTYMLCSAALEVSLGEGTDTGRYPSDRATTSRLWSWASPNRAISMR